MSEYTGYVDSGSWDSSAQGSYEDGVVTLGDFVFQGWEVPEKITWGGQQRMTVHKFVGGTRYIDVMGEDNADISWAGRFLGQDASARADQLDQMRKSGAALELIYAGRYYLVVISNFVAQQEFDYHVPYQITVTPVADNSYFPSPSDSALSSVTDDVTSASDTSPEDYDYASGSDGAAAVMAPLGPAQDSVAAIPPLLSPMTAITPGSSDTTVLSNAVNTASSQTDVAQGTADSYLAGLAAQQQSTGNLSGSTTAAGAIDNMNTALAASYASTTACTMNGYLGRVQQNISIQ